MFQDRNVTVQNIQCAYQLHSVTSPDQSHWGGLGAIWIHQCPSLWILILAQLFHPEVTTNNNNSVKPKLSSNIWIIHSGSPKEKYSAVCVRFSGLKNSSHTVTELQRPHLKIVHIIMLKSLQDLGIFELRICIWNQHMAFFNHISGQCASVHWKHMAWACLTHWRELDTIT